MTGSPKYVCITGVDGSGKSTLISRVMEKLEIERNIEIVTVWDMLHEPSLKNKMGFKTKEQVHAYLNVLHPVSRTFFLFHSFYQALELAKARKPEILLIESYWYKYYATEIAHGADAEEIHPLVKIFPEPAITFYLDIDLEEAYKRKNKISGYESGYAIPLTISGYLAFQQRACEVLRSLKQEHEWIEMDGTKEVETLANDIIERINSC